MKTTRRNLNLYLEAGNTRQFMMKIPGRFQM